MGIRDYPFFDRRQGDLCPRDGVKCPWLNLALPGNPTLNLPAALAWPPKPATN
jgi:hypothetical protein